MLRPFLRPFRQPFSCRSITSNSLRDVIARGAPIDVHPEVQDALAFHKPVVALETTIVTHGMPYPTNLDTARSVERIIRENGAIPATIGLIEGRVKIGLANHELERLADVQHNPSVVKVSRRDIGPVISLKKDGGTTCSTTLIFAAIAGIKVFATGGLGGVHRGGENSMDVSADLQELTRCPVGLVSAGVKSILDIGRTLEYLETLGVPVVSYGPTNDFPAFYTRRSGFKSPWRVDDPVSAAGILYAQQQLGMTNGTMFGVPIPEEYESVGQKLQEYVELALKEAEENGVSKLGKEATPWLLKRVGELTQGKSLASNIALIENTARIGGQIAVAYSKLIQSEPGKGVDARAHVPAFPSISPVVKPSKPLKVEEGHTHSGKLVVIGSTAVDVTAQANTSDSSHALHSTVPGAVSMTLGGVGRNIAESAHRILSGFSSEWCRATMLVSPVGKDSFGRLLLDETEQLGMRTDGIVQVDTGRTAVCNMVLDRSGGLTGGVADMDIIQSFGGKLAVEALVKHRPAMVAVDGNLSQDCLKAVVRHCSKNNISVFFEPTSVIKSTRILSAVEATLATKGNDLVCPVTFASPNLLELARMYEASKALDNCQDSWWKIIDSMELGSEFRMDLEQLARRSTCDQQSSKGTLSFLVDKGVAQMAIHLLPFFRHLIVKCGDLGIITAFRVSNSSTSTPWAQERTNVKARQVISHAKSGASLVLKHYPAIPLDSGNIINVTGAGDSLVGSVLSTLVRNPGAFDDPASLDEVIHQAQQAAVMTLQSPFAVSPKLSTIGRIIHQGGELA